MYYMYMYKDVGCPVRYNGGSNFYLHAPNKIAYKIKAVLISQLHKDLLLAVVFFFSTNL